MGANVDGMSAATPLGLAKFEKMYPFRVQNRQRTVQQAFDDDLLIIPSNDKAVDFRQGGEQQVTVFYKFLHGNKLQC